MPCSKAEDLINQLIEATLKLLDFGLNIMDALRVQKLLKIRNEKIGLINDDLCLPSCSLKFSLNFDLMMFNKLLRNACLRSRSTLNELRVCRLRYPNAPLLLEPKTKIKFQKLQKQILDFDMAVRSDKMISRRDLRDFREIAIIFSQLEHDLKLLICSLECASTMKDTVLFAAPITDVMTVLSIVLNRLERLAQKAEIEDKISPAQHENKAADAPGDLKQNQTNLSPVVKGKNTNQNEKQIHRRRMIAAAAAAPIFDEDNVQFIEQQRAKKSLSTEITTTRHRHNRIEKSTNFTRSLSRTERQSDISTDEKSLKEHHQPINRRQIKQYRYEFVRQWANDARHTCSKQPMKTIVNDRDRYSTTSSPSTNHRLRHRHRTLNNSATVHLQSDKSPDDLQCRIS